MLTGRCLKSASKLSHRDRSPELNDGMIAGTASLMSVHFAYWIPYFPSRRDNTQMRSEIGITSWICHRWRVPIEQSRRNLVFQVIQFSCIYLQLTDWMQACCSQTQSIYHP